MPHPFPLPSRRLVLLTFLVFNLGFYAVVPFLADYLRADLLMGSAMIGLVLGARTFSQQGLFFVGGWLAHLLGYRPLMLLGCAVRIAGYLLLAVAPTPALMVLGACLTGFGGALFTPCLEALIALIDQRERAATDASAPDGACVATKPRPSLFARYTVYGQVGSVAGPMLGGFVLHWGFGAVALACACVFALAALGLYAYLPRNMGRPAQASGSGHGSHWHGLWRNRPFMGFALVYSTYLFSYNQLYMSLPQELARVQAPEAALAWCFTFASVLVVALQMPIARAGVRWPERQALALGFALMALAFLALALGAIVLPAQGWLRYTPAALFVLLLSLGQMLAAPIAMSLVPRYARGQALALYYGMLASVGGAAVLLGNVLLGLGQDLAGLGVFQSGCLAALLPLASACCLWWRPGLLAAIRPGTAQDPDLARC